MKTYKVVIHKNNTNPYISIDGQNIKMDFTNFCKKFGQEYTAPASIFMGVIHPDGKAEVDMWNPVEKSRTIQTFKPGRYTGVISRPNGSYGFSSRTPDEIREWSKWGIEPVFDEIDHNSIADFVVRSEKHLEKHTQKLQEIAGKNACEVKLGDAFISQMERILPHDQKTPVVLAVYGGGEKRWLMNMAQLTEGLIHIVNPNASMVLDITVEPMFRGNPTTQFEVRFAYSRVCHDVLISKNVKHVLVGCDETPRVYYKATVDDQL